jgi:hypothetical protein
VNDGEPKVVAGTHEIVYTLIFNVPPGVEPKVVADKLAETVSVSIGMVGFLRETSAEARVRKSPMQLL